MDLAVGHKILLPLIAPRIRHREGADKKNVLRNLLKLQGHCRRRLALMT